MVYGDGWDLAVGKGTVSYCWAPGMAEEPLHPFEWVDTHGIPFTWWFLWRPHRGSLVAAVPLWAPLALALVPTALAWRLDGLARCRVRLGHCPHCGYDRAGLAPGAVCPECGSADPVGPQNA